MKLYSINQSGKALPQKMLDRWLNQCEKQLPKRDQKLLKSKEVLIVFVSRKHVKNLNKNFRGKDYPTDILSFESMEDHQIGELVLSPEVIFAQAKRTGLSYHRELCYMILHGLLHLLGYDHETSQKEAKKMFDLQNQIFDRLAPRFDFR
ncbi:MAG TPA: rRNA maturation RNase YbeY [Bdellovibrionales bacterium]|nr:rRNA maturation RNase YbeY [Pseudobdellovibrionaceae bacterium]HAG91935.1 rRNA maturation RNase YbeY [Bdellovibrionales bacterium]|tara:strand:- start:3961 stop:4407 length:447 start_codon:yes stop_codon:yes gene_type:complete